MYVGVSGCVGRKDEGFATISLSGTSEWRTRQLDDYPLEMKW